MQEKIAQAFILAKEWDLVKIFGDDSLIANNLKGRLPTSLWSLSFIKNHTLCL